MIFYFAGTVIWFIFLTLFVCSFKRRLFSSATEVLLVLVVAGPPFFYGCMYHIAVHIRSSGLKTDEVEKMLEIWGPFWAAVAALCLIIYDKAGARSVRSSTAGRAESSSGSDSA